MAGVALLGQKDAAHLRLHAQHREKAGGNQCRGNPLRSPADVDVETVLIGGREVGKALVVFKIDEFRRRHPVLVIRNADAGEPHPELHQFFGLLVGQRLQDHRVHHAEDGGVGADTERQREHGDDGESGAAGENPDGIAAVLQERFHRHSWALDERAH